MKKARSAEYDQLLGNRNYKYKENDPDYKGDFVEDDLLEGPVDKRSCTDIICLLIFIAAWILLIMISVQAFQNKKPFKLAQPYDSDGHACGVDPGYVDYKYLYFTNPQYDIKQRVCVKQCPQNNQTISDKDWCKPNSLVTSCTQNVLFYATSAQEFTNFCQPNIQNNSTNSWAIKNIYQYLNLGNVSQYINDVKITWPIILACAGFAVIFGFIFMFLLKTCGPCLVWGGIISYLVLLIGFGFLFFHKYKVTSPNETFSIDQTEIGNKRDIYLTSAISLWTVGAISLLLTLCLFKRIKLAIAVIQAASEFIKDVKFVLIVPVLTLIVASGIFIYIIVSTFFLYTSGDIQKLANDPFGTINVSDRQKQFIAYNILMLIWNMEFFIAVNLFIVSCATSIWYFSGGFPNAPLWRSFKYTFLHIGSLAFGSFILLIVWTIRFIFEFIHQRCKDSSSDGCFMKFVFKCVQCCLDCFERFVRFIASQAYIQIAITGKGFCKSAYEAFYLTLRNAGRFAALSGVGGIIIWIGKLFITTASTILGFLIITQSEHYKDEVYSPIIPTIIFAVASFIIGEIFMSLYGMSAEAILFCYCIDEEVHQRRGNIAQKCPKPLRDFMKDQLN